uniref:zinc finger BED domain-containing protein RICESLEEPER 1-like n=1 Tax=Erigeron canadensis TaxID=72917 RepID=UPI001CB88C98|nr:zinc finger BED domain-containing protein RICESLEEPER 1-like [Erigeron canadensis]
MCSFFIFDQIGEGSYSVVYKARDTLTEDIVALKKLQCDPSDPESVKMISMEIAILRRLDHPNVIKLKGIVTSRMSETLYLVFEYMDHDLATLSAKADMHFTEHQVKHYMNQLLSGLKYCHDHQVLHRDIKGSDLLLDNNGVLKIADFGCASFFDLIHEQPMTNRVATFWYRAPELLLGATEYGVGVDLWSAGCILAGLLAKGPILAGHTEGEQIQKIYALCGSPSDEYWKTYKLPLENIYKPELQSRRRIRETFNDFSPSSLSLLDILLSIDPVKRQTAASALRSKFLSDVCQPNKSESSKKEGMGSMISNTSLAGPRKQDDYVHGSVVWDHFTELVDHGGKKICRCNYCSEDYDYASTFGSSMLMNHIKNCVSNPYGQRQSKSKLSFPVTKVGNIRETKISLYSWRFDQQVASKSIVEMIIRDKLPFKFVENEGFRRCMELCQPALVIPSLSAIRHDCYGLLVDEKEKLKSILKESTLRVCLTTDTWTSVQRVNYMCLTAHFIDINWKLQKKVIDFFPISNLKGSDIGRAIELCLVNWDLRNVFTVTANSASSNDTVVEYLTRHFVKRGNLCVLNGKWTHVRCINHIISLVVHDAMKEIGGSVDRIRAAVKYVTESPPTMKKFQEFAKLEKLNCEKPLCLDIPTHWSSTYFMLRIAIIYEKAFDRFAIADFLYRSDLQEGPGVPCSFDWDNVRRLVGFLQHYYQLSIRVSGTKYITSNIFLDYICCIHNVFKECSSSEDAEIRKMSSVMKRKFDRYWGEIGKFNLLVYIASVFDPRTKYMYLEVTLCKMYGDEDGTKIATLCKNTLYELFNDYQRIHYGDHLKNVFSSSNVMNHSSTSPRQSMGLFGRSNDAVTASREKNLAKLERKKEELGVTNDPKSELDIYLTQEIEGDDYYFRSKEFSVLDWWKKRSETFPILSLVARDVLAIPVSTMAESSFSTRGRVLNSFRTTFNPKTIQALICCQDWIRPSDAPVNVEQHIQGLHKFEEGMRETFKD